MKRDESIRNDYMKSPKSLCSEAKIFIQIKISTGYVIKILTYLLPRCRQSKKIQRTSIDEWR